MKQYILFHAADDVFTDEESMRAAAAQRDGYGQGYIICMLVDLPEIDDLREGASLEEAYAEAVESDPVPIYGAFGDVVAVAYAAPSVEEEETVEMRFPGKIKETNLRANGNAYKDTPLIRVLRDHMPVAEICAVLNKLEETNAQY